MKRFYKLSTLTASLFLVLFLCLFSDTTAYADTSEVHNFTCTNVTEIPAAECEALVEFFNSTDGSNWADNTGWLQNDMPCSWYGTGCHHLQGNVRTISHLNFFNNRLSGPFPSVLEKFPNLIHLNLDGSQFSGPIPPTLGGLSKLTHFALSGGNLTGPLPSELGELTSLIKLSIQGTQITGSIPSTLGVLPNLTDLRLNGNQLSGSIPSVLGEIKTLRYLSLYNNQLSDSIPSALGGLENLEYLILSNNQLSGTIPSALGGLSSLIGLDLQQNQLTGSIPTTFDQLQNLKYFNVFLNQLSGSIPPEFGQLTSLERLFFHANKFSGPLPDTFINLTSLNEFYFYSTQLCEPESLTAWLEAIEDKRGTEPCQPSSIYLSSSTSGSVGSIRFRDEDILVFDADTNSWSLYFDGSKVGLGRADVNAFHIQDDGNILLSLNRPMRLDGVRYDDSDIILFAVDNIGSRTAGTFSRYFDGSDVQLTTGHEDIDAIGFTPDGDLVISTLGNADVGFLAKDEDLLRFEASNLGDNTSGTWHLYFDGSTIGLTTGAEDISAVWIDDETGEIHLSALRHYSVESNRTAIVSGDEDDIFICDPISLGTDTNCVFTHFWNGDNHGYGGERIDGYAIGPNPSSLFLRAASHNGIDGDPGLNDEDNEPDLTENEDDDILDEEDVKMRVYLPVVNQ